MRLNQLTPVETHGGNKTLMGILPNPTNMPCTLAETPARQGLTPLASRGDSERFETDYERFETHVGNNKSQSRQ